MRTDCPSCGDLVRADARFCPLCGMPMRDGATSEIELDQISAYDSILIHTRNSEYRFSIVDPAQRRGVLSGGTFGDDTHDATLVGALIRESDPGDSDTSWLKTDARALFYLRAEAGITRFTTSMITKLAHIRRNSA
ncbi:MAG: zinc ribbon domain-containing protein [Blastocatellia bacterium]